MTSSTTPEAPTKPGTDVIVRAHEALPPDVRSNMTVERMKVIAAMAPNLTISDLVYGCILEHETGLSLIRKELYLTRGRPKDGRPGELLAIAGVYGLLANAQKHDDFGGWDGDVVRKNDEYQVTRQPNGERAITHSYSGSPGDRGEIVGAWAQVYLKGRSSVYFFAPWEEYAPKDPKWGSAWKNTPSAMISKCPLSLCLRRAYDLGGVVGEEEAARWLEDNVQELSRGEGNGQVQGLELSPDVEEVIARAERLEHRGLASRASWETNVGRPSASVADLVARAHGELDDLEARREAEAIQDAVVEPDPPLEDDVPEVPVEYRDAPDEAKPPEVPVSAEANAPIEWFDDPAADKRFFVHRDCEEDGEATRWSTPLGPLTASEEECPGCGQTLHLVPTQSTPPVVSSVPEPAEDPTLEPAGSTTEPEEEIDVEALHRRLRFLDQREPQTDGQKALQDEEKEWIESQLTLAAERESAKNDAQGTLDPAA